jgi:hypothetical protein
MMSFLHLTVATYSANLSLFKQGALKMANIEDSCEPTLWDVVEVLVAQAAQRRREGQRAAADSSERAAAYLRAALESRANRAHGTLH